MKERKQEGQGEKKRKRERRGNTKKGKRAKRIGREREKGRGREEVEDERGRREKDFRTNFPARKATKDLYVIYECVQCIKAVMNNDTGMIIYIHNNKVNFLLFLKILWNFIYFFSIDFNL